MWEVCAAAPGVGRTEGKLAEVNPFTRRRPLQAQWRLSLPRGLWVPPGHRGWLGPVTSQGIRGEVSTGSCVGLSELSTCECALHGVTVELPVRPGV